jgi:hypothetical protein
MTAGRARFPARPPAGGQRVSGSAGAAAQEARSHVTENPLPLLFSALGSAFVAPELSAIVISSSVNEEITPEVVPSVTVAPVSFHVLNWASGSTPEFELGASAIHSALLFAQLEQVSVLVKLSAGCWESVTASV